MQGGFGKIGGAGRQGLEGETLAQAPLPSAGCHCLPVGFQPAYLLLAELCQALCKSSCARGRAGEAWLLWG